MKILRVSLFACAIIVLTSAEFCTIDGLFKNCPRGWKEFRGRCFLYVETELSWANAEKYCRSMNANLASIQSDDEENFLDEYFDGKGSPDTWIGASDCVQENSYWWTDGADFAKVDWCEGQPLQDGSKYCLMLNNVDDCWSAEDCSSTKAFLCAKNI
ncbi:ladderlectin-like [Synchiropus picturatus]